MESGEEDSLKNNGQQGLQVYTTLESIEPCKFVAVDQESTLRSTVNLDLDKPLKVGDRVIWDNCPSHCHWANPFTIRSIEGDRAMLEWYMKPVPIGELRLAIIDAA